MIEDKKAGIHIPLNKLTLKKLLVAIEQCQTQEFIENAKRLSKIVNSENGVEEVIKLIEDYSVS
jgi:UDP:flavonoid glycosyltransferase YjiC (YdhE family)